VEALERVGQSGTVWLAEDVAADLDLISRVDPEDVRIEGPVVQGAHGDPNRDDRLTAPSVRLDMCGPEELPPAESAQRTLPIVGEEDLSAEDSLVKPGPD